MVSSKDWAGRQGTRRISRRPIALPPVESNLVDLTPHTLSELKSLDSRVRKWTWGTRGGNRRGAAGEGQGERRS